jgi:hypothetical protein
MNNRTLTTPRGKHAVVIKEWITGRDAEYIGELAYEAMDMKANAQFQPEVGKVDIKKILDGTNHRTLEKFVISVDGKTDNVVDAIYELPEEDTAFVLSAIEEQRKKK